MKKTIVFLVLTLACGPLLAQSKRLIPAGTAKLTGEDPHLPPPFRAVAHFLDLSPEQLQVLLRNGNPETLNTAPDWQPLTD